ncbi:MAG: sugar transferase (PEP-CTERM/EpsH1 system associated) [Motiliproteus sp.]|jgi:sugar transferase (PEP-CTERM/EpsH1 system associated)
MRPSVLFLTHRIPYPPNKGDKIRSYHLLLELSSHYDVHLGCFVDDPEDWQYIEKIRPLCASLLCLPVTRSRRYIKAALAFFRARPITLCLYGSHRLQRWVEKTVRQQSIKKILVFSGAMAQFVDAPHYQTSVRVIDFVDVDSDKWVQYAQKKTGIARWVYQREHRLLQRYEQAITERFDKVLFVSATEAELFRSLIPRSLASRVDYLNNGVDSSYFDPQLVNGSLQAHSTPFIVFTGAMDYWANEDAVTWFCGHVWPNLSKQHPELSFLIVGSNPTSAVKKLGEIEGVLVTGRVEDVRPYIKQALHVVAPLQIARGIQNKVLEAMAMAKTVVATRMAMEGIPLHAGLAVKIADSPEAFIQACDEALNNPQQRDTQANRRWIQQQFNWKNTLETLHRLLEKPTPEEPG